LTFIAAALFFSFMADAHSGAVRGRVTDANGNALGGVVIIATSPEGGETVQTKSRRNGKYAITIPELDWPWVLHFSLDGFEDGSLPLPEDVTNQTRVDFVIYPEQRIKSRTTPFDPDARTQAEDLYNRGVDLMDSGDTPGASELFRKSVAIDPSFDLPLKALTAIAAETGDWEQAGDDAETLLALVPDDVSAMGTAYAAAMKTLDLERIEPTARRFAAADPTALDDMAATAAWLVDSEYYPEAVALLTVITNLAPEQIDSHYQLGFAANAVGGTETALASFNRFLELAPADRPDRAVAEALIEHLKSSEAGP
jgi:hypothetical protein